jgi:hypothetical protein
MLGFNLPPLLLLHSASLLAIGTTYLAKPIHSRADELRATLGSASVSMGLVYLMTSYMPLAENQFLHASVPIRLVTSAVVGSMFLGRRGSLSKEGRTEFAMVAVYDGVLAAWLGWYLGRWDGRVGGSWFA